MPNSTDWAQSASKNTDWMSPGALVPIKGIILDDSLALMDDSIFKMDDAMANLAVPSTNWANA